MVVLKSGACLLAAQLKTLQIKVFAFLPESTFVIMPYLSDRRLQLIVEI